MSYRNTKTGTVYVDVDEATWGTGYVRVETQRGAKYVVKTSSLERLTGDEEPEDEFADIPQGKPEGMRLGDGEESQQMTCSACSGAGSYPVDYFGAPDPQTGERELLTKQHGCVVCSGTGVEQVMAR